MSRAPAPTVSPKPTVTYRDPFSSLTVTASSSRGSATPQRTPYGDADIAEQHERLVQAGSRGSDAGYADYTARYANIDGARPVSPIDDDPDYDWPDDQPGPAQPSPRASRRADARPARTLTGASGYEKIGLRVLDPGDGAAGVSSGKARGMAGRDSAAARATDGSVGPALATRLEKAYMAVAAATSVVVIGVAFAVFALVEERVTKVDAKTRTTPVYLAIFILAQLFSMLYSFDALRARNLVQLLLHLFFQLCILTYAILEIPQTRNTLADVDDPDICVATAAGFDCTGPGSFYRLLEKLMIVPPVVTGLALLASAYLVRLLYVEFGWAVFHLVGASPRLKTMHREYQTLVSLLKLFAFFGTAFCVAYLILVTDFSDHKAEFIITIVALPLALLAMLVCGWALRVESMPAMSGCLALMVGGLAYFIYKLASMWLPRTEGLYQDTRVTMAIFSIFAIIILMCTFINSCVCMASFGKGLVELHQNPENRTSLFSMKPGAAEKAPRPESQLIID